MEADSSFHVLIYLVLICHVQEEGVQCHLDEFSNCSNDCYSRLVLLTHFADEDRGLRHQVNIYLNQIRCKTTLV